MFFLLSTLQTPEKNLACLALKLPSSDGLVFPSISYALPLPQKLMGSHQSGIPLAQNAVTNSRAMGWTRSSMTAAGPQRQHVWSTTTSGMLWSNSINEIDEASANFVYPRNLNIHYWSNSVKIWKKTILSGLFTSLLQRNSFVKNNNSFFTPIIVFSLSEKY